MKKEEERKKKKIKKSFVIGTDPALGLSKICFHQFQGGEVGQTISEAYKLSRHITMFSFFISHFVFKKQPDEVSR